MYIKTYEKFSNLEPMVLGVDLDGVLNSFTESYNEIYKKHFPNYKITEKETDDWNFFEKYKYDGEDPYKWFLNHKPDMWKISTPYSGAQETMKNIYKLTQNNGILLRIVTMQPGKNSQKESINWLTRHNFKYDDIAFVDYSKQKWDNADVLIDDSPKVLGTKPSDKISIKVMHLYNIDIDADFGIKEIKYLNEDLLAMAFEKFKTL